MSANHPLETTHDLVGRIRAGNLAARERLIARYLPILSRWAHGRLPQASRDLSETADLVQITLLRAFQRLPTFSVEGPGAFFAFLRQVMTNILLDELRRSGRRPPHDEIDIELPEAAPEPLAIAVSAETYGAYERALAALDGEQREAVVMRVELGMPHDEIAAALGLASADAARMRVARALVRLAELMREYRD